MNAHKSKYSIANKLLNKLLDRQRELNSRCSWNAATDKYNEINENMHL